MKPLGREGYYFQNTALFWELKIQIANIFSSGVAETSTQYSEIDLTGMSIALV